MSNFTNKTLEFLIEGDECGLRLDKLITYKLTEISRTKIKKCIQMNNLELNGHVFNDASYRVRAGDRLKILIPACEPHALHPKQIALDVVYEDNELMVINKQPYLTVHPGAGNMEDTLVNALLFRFGEPNLSSLAGSDRPGIVHRLDRDTSGLLVVAKNDITHAKLSKQLALRQIKRTYHAVVYGHIIPGIGVIEANISRSESDRKKMAVVRSGGRTAITGYKTLAVFGGSKASLIECTLQTGRTHQIRVHLAHKNIPIIGDKKYGLDRNHNLSNFDQETAQFIRTFPRQALHAIKLEFTHPTSKEVMAFSAKYPSDIEELLTKISLYK